MSRFEGRAMEGTAYRSAGGYADSESGSGSDGERAPGGMLWRKVLSVAALVSVASVACVLASALVGAVRGADDHQASGRSVAKTSNSMQFDAVDGRSVAAFVTAAPAALPVAVPQKESAARSLLKPVENLKDGNSCESNEELFEGLCYHKCSLLTMGKEPIRTSAWTCCKEQPCLNPANEDAAVGKKVLCSGYDVSGTGTCPHKPGACLTDEELFLGWCYKKCDALSDGEFPHRIAPATCCKVGGLGCLDIRNDRTQAAYAVGGGGGDHDPSTPSKVHAPQTSLTEANASGSALVAPGAAEPAEANKTKPELAVGGHLKCGLEEELYGGLCYRKCGLLTYGEYSIRTSSWTCCKSHPCTLTNQKGSIGTHLLCNGFDVAGDGKCPKAPVSSACAADEEEHLGTCFRKCSILTKGDFTHRVAAATCCKTNGLGCLDVFNDKTNQAFDVGSAIAKKEEAGSAKAHFTQGSQASAFMMKK